MLPQLVKNKSDYSTDTESANKFISPSHYGVVTVLETGYTTGYFTKGGSHFICHICGQPDPEIELTLMCMGISEKSLSEDWNSKEDEHWNNV
jgi:acetoin utilization deacetylase AcuC-like enzyme